MKKFGIAALLALLLLPTSCRKDDGPVVPSQYDNVVIFYTDGYNNLTGNIRDNAKTICQSALPMKSNGNALIWVAHNSVSYSDYETPVSPVIIQVTSDWSGAAVLDTLKTYKPDDRLTDPDIMTDAFNFVRENFKSRHYGAVFSSHGTGWLPRRYYSKSTSSGIIISIPRFGAYLLKSFGASYEGTSSKIRDSHEIEIQEMAAAIPMHLDYMIFDACLMGGVEVAYELRKCTDVIGFSQAEILTSGFDYSTFSRRLLVEKDPVGFCRDYYTFYNDGRASSKSATISVIRCGALDKLASVCAVIFDKYRSEIGSVDPKTVQGFFTNNKHWFYDLEDILVKSGISGSDYISFKEALDECILFEGHTPRVLSFEVKTSCGLSCFLPAADGSTDLRSFYKSLSWNQATGLVK